MKDTIKLKGKEFLSMNINQEVIIDNKDTINS